ncbi:hypothetical protein PSAC2689_40315 [Paraburkholderia sacchari]|uniref:hypothetical protein n=1 Tax=Paraburkholderia sacchari TaxID=159450 RepID=UPI0039A41242
MQAEAVVKKNLTTAADGNRYRTQFYNLDMILAVGYRVKFPSWHSVPPVGHPALEGISGQGFVTDAYFDELLQRIRDTRSSEKRF